MGFNLPLYKLNVDFTSSTQSIEVGSTVSFTSQVSGATNYYWNFGNGSTSTQSSAIATYLFEGTYSVSLMAANENSGGVKVKQNLISVVPIPAPAYISSFNTLNQPYEESSESYFVGGSSWRFTGGDGRLAPTTDIDIAAGADFTCEMFVKQTSNSGYTRLMSIGAHATSQNFSFYLTSNEGNVFYLGWDGSYLPFAVQSGYLNVWRHYAIVRKNNVIKLYVDGVADATTYNISGSLTTGSNYITIPNTPDGAYGAQGYYSNFRWTSAAVYDGNFTPATGNLSALPDTKVLLTGPFE